MEPREDFHALVGAERTEWRDGFVRLSLAVAPRLLNRAGILHGGVLMTLLDEAGALCGVWCSVPGNRRSSVTVDMDCRMVAQASTGVVYATGHLVSRGRSLYFTRTEIADAAGRVLAYGASTHKWRRGSETLEGLPPA